MTTGLTHRTRLLFALLALFGVFAPVSCSRPSHTPENSSEINALRVDRLPVGPTAAAWDGAPRHRAGLLLQDLVEPRQLKKTTEFVDVQALTDGQAVAFRLSWADPSKDDLPGASRFSDACAVQMPREAGEDLPAPQMGEPGRVVEIAYWRASWQAVMDGRKDDIKALYPGAKVDHYPSEAAPLKKRPAEQRAMAARYAPARALGNQMGGGRKSAVQDLVAHGPGTLQPAGAAVSSGKGVFAEGSGWRVQIRRPLPAGLARGHVALGIWQGAAGEVGARKMRSGWIPLHISGR